MSLRLVRKSERELIAEGGYRARWLRWEKWEEDWNRLQARRAKVGILRPEDNNAAVEINGGIQRRGAVHIPPEEREATRHDAVISRRPAHIMSLLKFRVCE